MKFVSLVIAAMILSFSASAQTTGNAAEKRTVAKVQQKKKGQKAKPSVPKAAASENADVTTLKDERAHKAKWTFEQMLKRRLEVDAQDSEKKQRKE